MHSISVKKQVINTIAGFVASESIDENDTPKMWETFAKVARLKSKRNGGLDAKKVAMWWKNRSTIGAALDQKNYVGQKGQGRRYPLEEEVLFMAFLDRRMNDGFATDGNWLQSAMRLIVTLNADPNDASDTEKRFSFKAVEGWLHRFKKKYKIKSLAITNTHTLPVSARMEEIKEFHRWFQEDLLGAESGLEGISPEAIFYVDQVPLSLRGNNGNRTLSPSGYGYVPSKRVKGASDKRLMTSQICIAAKVAGNGPQPVRLALLLRGQGYRLEQEELDAYRACPEVQVYFQKKAWADSQVMLAWLEQFDVDTKHIAEKHGTRILGFDGLGSHMSIPFLERCVELDIFCVCVPPHCTDILAPVDHHVGLTHKKLIRVLYQQDIEESWRQWNLGSTEGGFSCSEKRIKLTEWAAAAWVYMSETPAYEKLFEHAFITTGWYPLNKDGSEDHLVKIKGCPNYRFR